MSSQLVIKVQENHDENSHSETCGSKSPVSVHALASTLRHSCLMNFSKSFWSPATNILRSSHVAHKSISTLENIHTLAPAVVSAKSHRELVGGRAELKFSTFSMMRYSPVRTAPLQNRLLITAEAASETISSM